MSEYIKFVTGLIILSYASYTDIKTHKASNKLWLIMGLVGVSFIIYQFIVEGIDYFMLTIMAVMFIVFYLLFQCRVIYGGADIKAFMALTLLMPFSILNLWFASLLFTMCLIPFLYFYYRSEKSFNDIMMGCKFPFMVSILFGFIYVNLFGSNILDIINL